MKRLQIRKLVHYFVLSEGNLSVYFSRWRDIHLGSESPRLYPEICGRRFDTRDVYRGVKKQSLLGCRIRLGCCQHLQQECPYLDHTGQSKTRKGQSSISITFSVKQQHIQRACCAVCKVSMVLS